MQYGNPDRQLVLEGFIRSNIDTLYTLYVYIAATVL